MDNTIIRNDQEGNTVVYLALDKTKVFSQYFMDWLHETCIAKIAVAFADRGFTAEGFDDNLKKEVCDAAKQSAIAMVESHMRELSKEENQEHTILEVMKMLHGGNGNEM
ncbi:MAG: hypothetical protein PHI85_05015 [Victivallaceae bacterium]|nr:hypothetical protein [Victivallaceae bacterium]